MMMMMMIIIMMMMMMMRERDQDMRQGLCRWINNNEQGKWTVHATANRANEKASSDPGQSSGSNVVTTSNTVSPIYLSH